ncbi:CHAT domain-containing protein [Pseudonocardia charpentierae]|uniref:CHAT domain-containing tetratricopeptide repeat protein n=1 Tax=Pseudonocardia charpentierae TaxID=3075545 RepID=A0ABU2NI34_9PSEU|nr:CHAT domain-containing tetratricopeptide repeat protein [Pseudonocardia sp. DSM 45834]MDT0353625.1 CHAT domain-containing tetratricopeptide repeat protein [Pseudonocardia sp. DSM 45834]
MTGDRPAQSAARELAERCRRESTRLLALLGPAGSLLARRLVDLDHDRQPLEHWWPRLAADPLYWRCLVAPEPMLSATAQVAMACLLITRGLDRRGGLLVQLARPYVDDHTTKVLGRLLATVSASWRELDADLAPGLAAHDRGDYAAALRVYDEVLQSWPNHPWPWHEKALTACDEQPAAQRSRHPAVRAALLRDPFYVNTLAMTEPMLAARVRADIEPIMERGEISEASLTRFGATAMRIDHWSAAHVRVLMRHIGVPFDEVLLNVSLTELGVGESYDDVAALTGIGLDPATTTDETAVTALVEQGLLLHRSGNTAEAGEVGRTILDQQTERTDRRYLAAAHGMVAAALIDRHDYVSAVRHLQQACDDHDASPGSSPTERVSARINLGQTHELLGDHIAARAQLQTALEMLRVEHDPDPLILARLYLSLAKAEAYLGRSVQAFRLLGGAQHLLDGAESEEAARLQNAVDECEATLHHLIGDEDGRVAALRAALDRHRAANGAEHPGSYSIENNLALALDDEHRAEARALLESSLRKRVQLFGESSPAVAVAYNNMAMAAYEDDDTERAAEWYERCLAIRRRFLRPTDADLLDSVAGLAACRAKLGDLAAATRLVLEVVRTDFQVASAAAGASHADLRIVTRKRRWVLDLLVTLALRHGGEAGAPNRAAVVSALVNTKTVATGVIAARPRSGRRSRSDLRAVASLCAALATRGPRGQPVDEHRERLEQVSDKLDELLAAADGGWDDRLPYIDVVAQLRADLPLTAAFVDLSTFRPTTGAPAVTDAVHLGTVISRDGVEAMIELAPVAEIEDLVRNFREEMRRFSFRDDTKVDDESAQRVTEIGRTLYRLLFAPLEPILARYTHLVLSLDGPMAQFPAACLVDADGKFGVERWMFTYLSSVHDLHTLAPPSDGSGVVVFADPAFGSAPAPEPATGVAPLAEALTTAWNALPGTRRELRAIARAVGTERLRAHTGDDASKTNLLRVDRPRVLHLATHAFYVESPTILVTTFGDDDTPLRIGTSSMLRTGIVLAGANERRRLRDASPDDGIVTALELGALLDLSGTELVVLSGCETAIGDGGYGDSVHGVRHACHTAGAQAVIAGLWPVTDAGAALLMSLLYTRLAATASAGEALHEATLEMLRRSRAAGRSSHPHGWAAFVVSGGVRAVLRPAL